MAWHRQKEFARWNGRSSKITEAKQQCLRTFTCFGTTVTECNMGNETNMQGPHALAQCWQCNLDIDLCVLLHNVGRS